MQQTAWGEGVRWLLPVVQVHSTVSDKYIIETPTLKALSTRSAPERKPTINQTFALTASVSA